MLYSPRMRSGKQSPVSQLTRPRNPTVLPAVLQARLANNQAGHYEGFNAFWTRDFRSLRLLNEAYLILLRKKENPEEIKDYRPISLVHSFAKLVTKCLANRLAKSLDSLVRKNQSAFIRGRCIHENFRKVQLACRFLHNNKRPTLLLKVDIAKAFDTVSWPFLLELLEHLGFSRRWLDWLSALLSTATSKILLNGRPGEKIFHVRGLRQGDPLLFVLVMEVLNGLLRSADESGYLSPLPAKVSGCRASFYADDVVVFLSSVRQDVLILKEVLRMFAEATGLHTNLDKCAVTPIRCSSEQTEEFRAGLGCRVVHFPCRYLGIPLSIYKLKKADEQAIIDSVAARILAWKGKLLNLAGRSTLTAVTLSAVPTHTAIAVCLSPWAVGRIDRRQRGFLWSGSETVAGGKCRVAWTVACRPKELGGLGLVDLRRFGIALQLRREWQRRLASDTAWASLPAQENKMVASAFNAATDVVLVDGRQRCFGWIDGCSIADRSVRLPPT